MGEGRDGGTAERGDVGDVLDPRHVAHAAVNNLTLKHILDG